MDYFFRHMSPVLFSTNVLMEHLSPPYSSSLIKLRKAIWNRKKDGGDLLKGNPSYFPNLALHANSKPGPSGYHRDLRSLHAGYDVIVLFGDFEKAWFLAPELGVRLLVRGGDTVVVKGSSFQHKISHDWEGKGRFVFVAFSNKELYPYHNVKTFHDPIRAFGTKWEANRLRHPATPVSRYTYSRSEGYAAKWTPVAVAEDVNMEEEGQWVDEEDE